MNADAQVQTDAPPLTRPGEPRAALRAYAAAIGFAAAVAAVFLVHLPVLGNDFFNDDFVPLADIASRSTPAYVRDLFLLDDLTPNWRFLTGLVYLAAYRAFGLEAFPYLLVSVLVHTATAGLVYRLVWRALGSAGAAFLAATLFGLTAAHVPTAGQVTALNNVLATFLLVAGAVVLYEALERGRAAPGVALASVLLAGAIAANESAAASAPLLALIVFWKLPADRRDGETLARAAALSAPFALLAIAAAGGFAACGCTEAELYETDAIFGNVWVYLGRLLYPVVLEPPGDPGVAHIVAGAVVLGLALLALARGPALGRIAAVWLALALVPYLPLGLWSAARYTYVAAVPFALLGAVYAWELGRAASRLAPAAPAALAFLALSGVSLLAWQAYEQNEAFAQETERWGALVTALEESELDPAAGSVVYLRGGPVTEPLAQCAVLPSIGTVLWGDGVRLFSAPAPTLQPYRVRSGYDVMVLDYADGRFVPARDGPVRADGTLLPHVDPAATGNLCRADVRLPQ